MIFKIGVAFKEKKVVILMLKIHELKKLEVKEMYDPLIQLNIPETDLEIINYLQGYE